MAGLWASDEFIRERTVNGIFAYATDEPNVPTAWPKGECKKPDVATAGPFSKGKGKDEGKGKPVDVNRLEARFRLVMMTQEAKAWQNRIVRDVQTQKPFWSLKEFRVGQRGPC